MQGLAHRHGRLIGLRLRAMEQRQRRRRGRAGRLQALQHSRDALVSGSHLSLVDLVQLQRLGQGEDVLFPVVADQRGAQGRERGLAAPVAQGGQAVRIALAGDNVLCREAAATLGQQISARRLAGSALQTE